MDEQMKKICSELDTFVEENVDAHKEQICGETDLTVYYIASVADVSFVDNQLKAPFFVYSEAQYERHLAAMGRTGFTPDELILNLCRGFTIAIYNGQCYAIRKSQAYKTRNVDSPQVEASIVGPLEAFVESSAININLIRKHYQSPTLKIVKFEIGKLSRLSGYLLYDSELADKRFVERELAEIDKARAANAQAVSKVQQYLPRKRPWLFPRSVVTERPDRTSEALSKGKAAYLIDTTPFASLAPINFHDFMASVDDSYMLPAYSYFLIVLRYIALFITIVLPGAYVAFTAFNPEVFRVQLALSIAGSRAGLPYPAFLEVGFMMLMTEMLVEASLRVPKTIGPAATTVGGLILGEAASQANLVSDIMIIVVAAVAIANFVIPINTMSHSVRVLKYLLLLLGTVAGFFGLTIGIVLIVSYVFTMKNNSYSMVQSFTAPVRFSTARGGRRLS